ARSAGDALGGAPTTYADVPRLGPPLPGDLGKPILENQRSTLNAIGPADQQLQQAHAAERERQLAELKAARESGLLVQGHQPSIGAEAAPAAAAPLASADQTSASKLALDTTNDPNAQGHKTEF